MFLGAVACATLTPRVARGDEAGSVDAVHTQAAASEDASTSDASDDDCARSPRRRTWYGWQTLSTDGAAMLSFALAGPMHADGLAYLGLALYGLGGPVVHALHGNAVAAAGSLFMRDAAPPILFLAGYALFHRPDSQVGGDFNFSGLGEGLLLGGVGVATAIVLDAAVLSFEPGSSAPRAKHRPDAALQWWPSLQPVRSGAMGGVGGSF